MSASRRELLAALGGAWLFASLGSVPAALWASAEQRRDPPWPTLRGDAALEHLLARCGFGARPGDRATGERADDWIERQLDPAAIDDTAFEQRLRRYVTFEATAGDAYEFQERLMRRELQSSILLAAVHSERRLRESMLGLWRDHFSLSLAKGECAWLATSFERDALRPNAIGSFRALLRAVLLHPAMLWSLDGRLNRADVGAPNENYARELLELHTLGLEGGYTQRDVQEVARALSGWTSRGLGDSRKGRVEFVAERHDHGAKRALGVELPEGLGEEEVERVIDLVCAHPATPQRIARRMASRFVADEPPASVVERAAQEFTRTDGDLKSTLRALLTSPEFRSSRLAKLKRPLHFVVSALRACDAECAPDDALLTWLERLGHAPYLWPAPDGYPDDALHWRSGLLARWRFADELAHGELRAARVVAEQTLERAGGRVAFAASCFGRDPTDAERALLDGGGAADAIAVVLASPGFQRC